MTQGAQVIIVGGGVIGAAVAYYLSCAGVETLVLERHQIAGEASGSNAGMVGALVEGPPEIGHLTIRGLQELARLETELEHGFELNLGGRLLLSHTAEQWQAQQAKLQHWQKFGLAAELLDGDALCRMEPLLAREMMTGALFVPGDGQVNPFLLTSALIRSATRRGARVRTGVHVTGLLTSDSAVVGVRTPTEHLWADHVVIASGAWAPELVADCGMHLPVGPGRGQMIVTEPLAPLFPRVLRGPVTGLRQSAAGNLMIGSTVDFHGFDKQVTPQVGDFLVHWQQVMPSLRSVRVLRTWSGLRPLSEDGNPYIGQVPGYSGLWLAAGHGRYGITWAGVTGLLLSQLMVGARPEVDLGPTDARRLVARRVANA